MRDTDRKQELFYTKNALKTRAEMGKMGQRRNRSVTTPALRWDNLQETHGPPPPSHSILISADLCGSVFHRSNHPGGENTGDNV